MYNQPSVVGMGRSRYIARHTSGLMQVAREESLDPDHALKANESIYIKRSVENPRQVLRSAIGLLGENAVARAPELLHVSVLQPETAFRLRPEGRTLRSLTISAKQVVPQLSRPMTIEFDRIASYPSREGDQTLYSLTYDHTEPTELDLETEAIIKRLGEVCGYHGTFEYIHDPHITIAIEAKNPPRYEEYMLDQPVTATLARAAFFAQRLA